MLADLLSGILTEVLTSLGAGATASKLSSIGNKRKRAIATLVLGIIGALFFFTFYWLIPNNGWAYLLTAIVLFALSIASAFIDWRSSSTKS